MHKLVAFVVLFAVGACGDDGNTTDIPDPCNPIDGHGCMLPWPSSTYLKVDPTSETGYRVDIPLAAMPTNEDEVTVDPAPLNRYDGFSMTAPLLARFETGVSPTNLPSHANPDESLAADSPIVLVDLDTGERAPFFAEVDVNTLDVNVRNLIIRPLARLKEKAHYGVIITNKVKAADGGALVSPKGFLALRDGTSFGHPRFSALKEGWTKIEAALGDLGIAKADVALAWEFRTASDDFMRSDLTTMREKALPVIGTNGAGLGFTVTSTKPNIATTHKRYLGTYKAPDFLTDGEKDASILRRGADGLPTNTGLRDARFAAIIPKCVTDGTYPLPRPTVVFGHGLFGSAEEYLDDDFVGDLAQDHCLVIVAGDFIGLTSRQLQLAPLAVNDMNRGTQISEKLAQSVVDFMSLGAVARGPMAAAADFQYNGTSVIDPEKVFYIGGSLGGIMGNTLMAYDPSFKKGVLAVPGGVWSMLFERSAAWFALLGAAQGSYTDPEVYQLVVSFLGLAMEPYDPITTAAHVIKDPLFGQPAKDILIWYTIGDCLVTNISTEMVLRTMGMKVLGPSVRSPWRIDVAEGPLSSGATVYDEHPSPMPPDTNKPPSEDNGTHSGVNRNPSALRQVEQFLLQNQVVAECKSGQTVVACNCNPDGGGVCD
jgi:pimeloyl-ACP methyl ester carboxylesterase